MNNPNSKRPTVNEILDNIDPVAAAEEAFGKVHEDFSDDENLRMLAMAMQFNMQKQSIQKGTGDTFIGSGLDLTLSLLTELGFVKAWEKSRTSRYGYQETESIWYAADGMVVYLDTYNGRSTNRFELVAELDPDHTDEKKWGDQYYNVSRVVSGGGSYGCYPANYEQPVVEKSVAFHADMRSGFRWKVQLLRSGACGTLKKVWEDPTQFLWFVNYDEEERYKYDVPYRELLKEKVKAGDEGLQRIMQVHIK